MAIRCKLVLGTCLLAALICIVGFYAASVARRALLGSIEESSSKQAAEVLAELNRALDTSIDGWRVFADSLLVQQSAQKSNHQFAGLPDVAAYLAEQDAAWQATPSDQVSPLMTRLMSNPLADDIRRRIAAVNHYQDHETYGEVLVTNRYGAAIALTSRTSDYQQDDETWWRRAMADGLYLGEVAYDESAKIYSIDICVRIDDPDGEPLGVIKSVQSVSFPVALLQSRADMLHAGDTFPKYHDEFVLLDADGKVIHSTRNSQIGLWSDVTYPLPPEAQASGGTYTFERHDEQLGTLLASCASSTGLLGWILVVENRAGDVLASADHLRNGILAMSLGIAVVGAILGILLSLSVCRRLRRLKDAAIELRDGNLQARIRDDCSDEIGHVSRCFNDLAESLMRSRRELDDYTAVLESNNIALEELNRMREEEIRRQARTEESLRRSQEAMNTMLNTMPVGMLVIGRDKVVRHANPAALRIMQRTSESDVVGKVCHECFCTATVDRCPILDLHKNSDTAEHQLVARDGSGVPILKTVIPIRLGEEDLLLETFVDISDRKQAEDRLQEHYHEVEEANRRLEVLVSGSAEREIRMVQLKQEVNELRVRAGEPPEYSAPSQIAESGLQLAATPDD